MVKLSRAQKGPKSRRTRSEVSIREVSLLANDAEDREWNAGDPLDWAGRTYTVTALDDGGYLHVRPQIAL